MNIVSTHKWKLDDDDVYFNVHSLSWIYMLGPFGAWPNQTFKNYMLTISKFSSWNSVHFDPHRSIQSIRSISVYFSLFRFIKV